MALGTEAEDRPFAKNALQMFRLQLTLHDKVRVMYERRLRLARESGYLKKRGMQLAPDTTHIPGRGAVKDTWNLLTDGMLQLMRVLAAVERTGLKEWASGRGYRSYTGASTKARETGRSSAIGRHDEALGPHLAWMSTPAVKEADRLRKRKAEPVLGIIKDQQGPWRFLLRGLPSVRKLGYSVSSFDAPRIRRFTVA